VVPPGTVLDRDRIVSSVPAGLAALIEAQGGEPMSLGIAQDTPESLVTLARTGSAADILVTIGGASVGERDLVSAALRSEGMELDFWKIAMRPGKPLIYGRLGHQRVLGMPGNPVAALICGLVFLVPMLHRLLGLREDAQAPHEAILGEALEINGPREHYMRAASTRGPGGDRVVVPLAAQDSSLMADFARADCLIVRPPDAPALAVGSLWTPPLLRGLDRRLLVHLVHRVDEGFGVVEIGCEPDPGHLQREELLARFLRGREPG